MKILSAEQTRSWDQATMLKQGISSQMLMERAAHACFTWIQSKYPSDTPFLVICGTGNNGGDGLAISRLLIEKGYPISTLILQLSTHLSPDCQANYQALSQTPGASLQVLHPGNFLEELPSGIIVIDAIFGTGLNRMTEGYAEQFIQKINAFSNTVISIDLPSGLAGDMIFPEDAAIINADHTLTFQQYKLSMLLPETGQHCGEIHLIDINLAPDFLESADSYRQINDLYELNRNYKPRQRFSHKGTYGTAMIIGGSHGMMGAPALAVNAAGRSGAGKVISLVPECGYEIMQLLAPEALCHYSGKLFLDSISIPEGVNAIAVGPGMGTDPNTVKGFASFLKSRSIPLVLDADALNILGKHPELQSLIPAHAILTPHPRELERLFGKTSDSMERENQVRQKAMELQCIIIAKNAYTLIGLPDGRCIYNISGSAALATAGSGDVLCGLITGLLAQGYAPEQAALLGVYLHGRAGELAGAAMGLEAVLAADISAYIGKAFKSLS